MTALVLGLLLFLGMHSSRIVAADARQSFIAKHGENAWKAVYSVAALIGFILIIWGYGMARTNPVVLWTSPTGLKHLALLLNLIAFLLLALYAVPSGKLKAKLGHPMVLAVKVWAFAHLLANGTLADLLLFGSFLVWAIVDFAASKRRDRRNGIVRTPGPATNDAIALVAGGVLWAFMIWRGHQWLIGVSPLA